MQPHPELIGATKEEVKKVLANYASAAGECLANDRSIACFIKFNTPHAMRDLDQAAPHLTGLFESAFTDRNVQSLCDFMRGMSEMCAKIGGVDATPVFELANRIADNADYHARTLDGKSRAEFVDEEVYAIAREYYGIATDEDRKKLKTNAAPSVSASTPALI